MDPDWKAVFSAMRVLRKNMYRVSNRQIIILKSWWFFGKNTCEYQVLPNESVAEVARAGLVKHKNIV